MSEVAQASHSSPDGKIPQLRFPEFNQPLLADILLNLTDILRCGIAATPKYVDSGITFLSSQNVTPTGKISMEKYNFISEDYYKKISKNSKLLKGDILYSRVGSRYGNAAIFPFEGDYGVYVSLTHIRASQQLNNTFLKFLLNSPIGKIQAKKGVFQGGGVPNLNVKIVEKFKINFPTKPEQQKIAAFLTEVDNKIEQLSKKQELLGKYKKGLMQKIFSQAIRFKADDGSDFPNWEEKKIVELAKTSIGLVTSMTPYYVDKGVPLIRNNDIFQNKVRKEKLIQLDYTFDELNKNRRLIVNDIVTVHTGDIGVSAVIDEELNGCQGFATLNTRILNKSKVNSLFLCWYYNSTQNIKYALSMATGDGRSNYNLKDFNKAIIPLPCFEEQTKIANFLSFIDNKIEQVGKQLDESKQFKKALLQQMFV